MDLEFNDEQRMLGGIGFTNDFDRQLYYRRAKHNQLARGDARGLEEAIACDVLEEGAV